jgi:hypothetical protein
MQNNRESIMVIYAKGFIAREYKVRYVENAMSRGFWDVFPEQYRPDKAHLRGVLTNTFTGYKTPKRLLVNPETKSRVRSNAEKNPMLYIYLFSRFAFQQDALVVDFFGGTLASMTAALYTDNKVLAFEKDEHCAKLAWDRVYHTILCYTIRYLVYTILYHLGGGSSGHSDPKVPLQTRYRAREALRKGSKTRGQGE